MLIKTVTLNNFRNFELYNIKADKLNVIYGKNASGKTNLIEAIFVLLNGHSFNKKNVILQRYNTNHTTINGTVGDENIKIEIENRQKTIRLNDKKSNILQLKKLFPSIIYSMDSFLSFKNKDYLFSLIDRNSFIEDKKILDYLIQYKKIMKIKKKILSSNQNIDENILQLTNNKLIEVMNAISDKRIDSVEYINKKIGEFIGKFTDKTVKLHYKKENVDKNITKMEIYKKRLMTSLNKDKIEIIFNGKNIFTYSSVGEKKIVLLSIVLSIVHHYNKYIKPILLIDDLEGDLDKESKKTAFDILTAFPNQLFLTTLGEYLYNQANVIRL